MVKKIHLIHHVSMNKDKPLLAIKEPLDNLKNKYPFGIKLISESSELLHNFNLPRYTECFFLKGNLYLVSEHIQTEIKDLTEAVYFLMPGVLKESDIDSVFNIIKEKHGADYFKLLKYEDKKEIKNFIVADFLFKKKINFKKADSNFDYMRLKSRRIISKLRPVIMKDDDLIAYLLNKSF